MLQSISVAHAVGEQFILLADSSDFQGYLYFFSQGSEKKLLKTSSTTYVFRMPTLIPY